MARKHLPRVDIITMGCSKNLVDSERLMRMFERAGYAVRHNPARLGGQVVIVNTCGFIGDAKQESIDTILECCQAKEQGRVKRVYVMGCLSERYSKELPADIPEVDGWYGKFDWTGVLGELNDSLAAPTAAACPGPDWDRTLTTPQHHAYLKIAEGCNRFCAFCAIPLITGRYKSRPVEEIADEVRELVSRGVKEFNVIAQDLSYYGIDLYGTPSIARLVDTLAQIEGVRWIRLHYAYPTQFPWGLLPVMAKHDNVCKYLDIALQHISDPVLANMRRHISAAETRQLLQRLRAEVPGLHIRTTLMVGFPGEGEEQYQELKEFVREQRFERMGAFAYCEEDDTYAAQHYADEVPQEVKEARLAELMEIQQDISLELNEAKVGTTLTVVIDGETDEFYVGRSQYDSPEVDPEVLVRRTGQELQVGEFYQVRVVEAMPFELIAELEK